MFLSTPLKNFVLGLGASDGTIKEALTLGRLFIFTGPVPASADAALDVTSGTGLHTQLVEMTVGGLGATGLSFGVAASGSLPKAAEVWEGPIIPTGALTALGTYEPTFLRFCETGDDGRTVANLVSEKRIQMTCNSAGTGEIYCPALVAIAGPSYNTRGFGAFFIRILDISF